MFKKLLKGVRRETAPLKKIEPPLEPPLILAVIHNEIDKVIQLKENRDQVLAKNILGFNSIEIARYLDREECLNILDPQPKKTFKVMPKDSSELVIFTLEEFQNFFDIHYLTRLSTMVT